MRRLAERAIPFVLLALAAVFAGCCSSRHALRLTSFHAPRRIERIEPVTTQAAIAAAAALEADEDERCVDAYFFAGWLAWQAVTAEPAGPHAAASQDCYNTVVAKLLSSAQRFGRLNATHGLVIRRVDQAFAVPITHHGFAWQATEFQRLHPP